MNQTSSNFVLKAGDGTATAYLMVCRNCCSGCSKLLLCHSLAGSLTHARKHAHTVEGLYPTALGATDTLR